MVRAGCVFVAGIHPSRTWTSGSFESVRWNACVHRLDLGLYSHPKEFGGEFEPMLTPREKIPSTRKCPQRRIEPATPWTASPCTTNWAILAPSWMVYAGGVFVVGIPLSRTWMLAVESIWWNACVHRLDLGLYFHPKEILGNGRKIPSNRQILLRGGSNPWHCIKQDSEPNTLPTELFWPPRSFKLLSKVEFSHVYHHAKFAHTHTHTKIIMIWTKANIKHSPIIHKSRVISMSINCVPKLLAQA